MTQKYTRQQDFARTYQPKKTPSLSCKEVLSLGFAATAAASAYGLPKVTKFVRWAAPKVGEAALGMATNYSVQKITGGLASPGVNISETHHILDASKLQQIFRSKGF
jgi:hypothetical protein